MNMMLIVDMQTEHIELHSYRVLPFIHIIPSPGEFRNGESVDQERDKQAYSSLWGNEEGTTL